MRMHSLPVAILLAFSSPAALAQQTPAATGEAIGHPPPLAGPPPAEAPDTTAATSQAPLAATTTGMSLDNPDSASTKASKAVRCGVVARETDGSTTCIGLFPDTHARRRTGR
jgi:hypothetical protein